MKYTLKIQLKNGGEVSSEPFELPLEPENFHLEADKRELPKSYSELGDICGYSITELDSKLRTYSSLTPNDDNRNLFATEAQANSALAYAQLTQLMKAYNGDWTPDWNDDTQFKYVIDREGNYLEQWLYQSRYCFLAFPTEELRDEFLKNFEPLIKTFYQL